MASPTGLNAPPTLAGRNLTGASASEVQVRFRELKTVRTAADGSAREQLAYLGEALPIRAKKRTFTVRWAHLRDIYDLVEEILAESGPHTLCLWRFEHLAWQGNGSRTTFTLPWQPAIHSLTPPNGQPASRYQPVAKVGIDGTDLTYVAKTAAELAAGTPGAGEAWFATDEPQVKVATAPAAAEVLHVRLVPLYSVVESPESEKRLASVLREPRDLVLVEA